MTYSKENIVVGMTYYIELPDNVWEITRIRDKYFDEIKIKAHSSDEGNANDQNIESFLKKLNDGDWKIINSPNQIQAYDIF